VLQPEIFIMLAMDMGILMGMAVMLDQSHTQRQKTDLSQTIQQRDLQTGIAPRHIPC
jgi:hypothetical protein